MIALSGKPSREDTNDYAEPLYSNRINFTGLNHVHKFKNIKIFDNKKTFDILLIKIRALFDRLVCAIPA